MKLRSKYLNVLFLILFLAACVFSISSTRLKTNTVVLPLEVYAPNGFDATTGDQAAPFGDETITINIADIRAADSLAFWMHQPSYHLGGGSTFDEQEGFDNEGAVSISINNGPFVAVTDATTDCAFPESQMGPWDNQPGSDNAGRIADNCIGGPSPSPRFSIPATASGELRTGDNTVTFRYNGSKGTRSGFRVLHLALLGGSTTIQNVNWKAGGLLKHGTTTFHLDDPTSWEAPDGGDPANGQALFTQRNLLTDHVHQANPSIPGKAIEAACSDCHAKDGSDLWYFNYSNESIIARSRFHGLSEQQGRDIAAYIRSIQLSDWEGRRYDPPGRPWNPPFQPGPTYGLDGSGVNAWDELTDDESVYWAAGAGLDDYLNSSLEAGKYYFPEGGDPGKGVPPSGISTFQDPTTGKQELPWEPFAAGSHNDIDLKKYPIAVQFPDWNMWLPDISPVGGISGGDIRTYNDYMKYYEWLAGNANSASWDGGNAGGLDPGDPSSMFRVFKRFGGMYRAINRFRVDVSGKGASSAIDAKEDLSIMQYNMVRVWEIYQYFDLYDHADRLMNHPQIDRPASEYSDWSLDIGIMGQGRHFFDSAPHILGDNEPDADHWHNGSFLGQKWATHVWYQLQTTVDPGIFAADIPVDWQYQDSHMREFSEHTHLDASYRMFGSQVRRFQQAYTPSIGVCPECYGNAKLENTALWAKQGQPFWALWTFAPNQESVWNKVFREISRPQKRRLTGAWLRVWWDAYKRGSLDAFRKRQCSDDVEWCWEPASHVPDPDAYVGHNNNKADRFYRGLKYAADANVAGGVIDSIAEKWASPMWPEANDENYRSNDLPYSWESISDVSHTIHLQPGWNFISSFISPAAPSLEEVFDHPRSITLVKDGNGSVYIPHMEINEIDRWRPSNGYMVYAEDTYDLTLSGSPVDRGTSIQLSEGWNFLPFYSTAPLDAATAFKAINDILLVVKDEDGRQYIPSQGINDIGQLLPGQGYSVYVTEDTSFSYPVGANPSSTSSRESLSKPSSRR